MRAVSAKQLDRRIQNQHVTTSSAVKSFLHTHAYALKKTKTISVMLHEPAKFFIFF